jgi:hypothetical protein
MYECAFWPFVTKSKIIDFFHLVEALANSYDVNRKCAWTNSLSMITPLVDVSPGWKVPNISIYFILFILIKVLLQDELEEELFYNSICGHLQILLGLLQSSSLYRFAKMVFMKLVLFFYIFCKSVTKLGPRCTTTLIRKNPYMTK